jgi:hypothetical protein
VDEGTTAGGADAPTHAGRISALRHQNPVEWAGTRPIAESSAGAAVPGAAGAVIAPARRITPGLVAHALLPLAIGAAWWIAVRGTQLQEMDDTGLVSVLPRPAIALLALLCVSFCVSLARRPFRPVVALLHVLVLVVALYGVTAFLEDEPRFATVWKHAGIIDYILAHGTVDPNIDAYFNWPGFFGLGALITRFTGEQDALAFAAWGSLAFNLLYLAPLLAIFRSLTADPRRVWLGVWIFYVCNWVGQDYMAPQAVAFLVWLAILAILLRWFTRRAEYVTSPREIREIARETFSRAVLHPRRLWRKTAGRFSPAPPLEGSAWRVGMLLLVVVLFTAMVVGHQLTPFTVILSVIALVVIAGLEMRTLPIVMIVIAAAWLTYMTTGYLAGNFSSLTSPLGSLGSNVNQNVGARLEGSEQHLFIVHLRMLATAGIWGLAVLGFLRRITHGRLDIAMAALGIVPFLLPILQPYGGEMLLRVFLFTLPAAAYFISALVFPTSWSGRGWLPIAAAACITVGLLGAFMYTRYGNESLDRYTREDLAAVQDLYRIAPRESTLIAGSANLPWMYKEYASYDYSAMSNYESWLSSGPAGIARELRRTYAGGDAYVIVTRSTDVGAALLSGRPGVPREVVKALRAMPGVTVVYERGDATILRLDRTSSSP